MGGPAGAAIMGGVEAVKQVAGAAAPNLVESLSAAPGKAVNRLLQPLLGGMEASIGGGNSAEEVVKSQLGQLAMFTGTTLPQEDIKKLLDVTAQGFERSAKAQQEVEQVGGTFGYGLSRAWNGG